jgi:polar amino acid transport system permease protein
VGVCGAGSGLMVYHWDFSVVSDYTSYWFKAAGITLAYSAGTVAGGLVIGIVCGIASLARKSWITVPIHAYVEIFRCTPVLVQIVWFYFALPIIVGVSLPAWLAAGLGLTLYMGSFSTEIVRAGIISIDRGQWQAARALGMTYGEMMRHVILPQAIRRMVPPFVNQSVTQLKNTSLLYVVAVPDLMYTGSIVVAETYRPLEVYTSVAAMYFVLLYPLTRWAKRLEAAVDQ